jgi:hypothetical protein|nr:MAG TPA: hypothetical protein [Bacteriophage sp.]
MSKKVDNIIFLNFNAFSGRLSKEVLASPQIMLLTSSIKVLEVSSKSSEPVNNIRLSSPALDLYLYSKVLIILSSIPGLFI